MTSETYTWDDLMALRKPWEETFGETMAYGFEIGPDDVPLLRQCIAEKSRERLRRHIEELLKDGRVY